MNINEMPEGEVRDPEREMTDEEREVEKQKREEREEFVKDLKVLYYSVLKKAMSLSDDEMERITNKMPAFKNQLVKNYPGNYFKYSAFHVLAGSTTKYEESPELDFPEPNSVESFLKGLEKELDEMDKEKRQPTDTAQ